MDKHHIGFRHAISGLITAFTSQMNLRIHLIFSIIILAVGMFFELSAFEWLVLVLTIGQVVTAELVNTAIEFACNAITRDHNLDIKHAKDISAAAVLFSATISLVVAFLMFYPKIISIWSN